MDYLLNQPEKNAVRLQFFRAAIYLLLIALSLLFHLGNKEFFSWTVYSQFYSIAGIGLLLNLFGIFKIESIYRSSYFLLASFAIDVGLIGTLQLISHMQISIYLFFYMAFVLLSALAMDLANSLLIAAVASVFFSLSLLLGTDLKSMTLFFQLLLYNTAFFVIAWIGGVLSEQLRTQGISLQFLRNINDSIIQTVPSGLVTVDKKGELISWNPSAIQILGSHIIEGKNIFSILPTLQNHLAEEKIPAKKIEEIVITESENKILSLQILPHKNDENHHLILIDDVTELRRLELQVSHQAKLAAIGGLASGIAHELGNPLAAVSANIQFLEPKIKIEDESDRKLIENTHREIDRLGRLIGEFKDFAKPEKVPVEKVRLDIMLREILEFVRKDPGLRKDVSLSPLLNQVPEVLGSKDKLTQAFLNILVNSFHAVAEVEHPEIQIVCVIRGEGIEVRISDNGVGMSEETLKRLFEPFYTTKGRRGTGLGLAITHKILEAHQAQIEVKSEKGKGSEFILQFPVQTKN